MPFPLPACAFVSTGAVTRYRRWRHQICVLIFGLTLLPASLPAPASAPPPSSIAARCSAPPTHLHHTAWTAEDGVWSPSPDSLPIKIPPTLTQAAWFRTGVVLRSFMGLLLLVMLCSRRRVARAQEQLRVWLQARERFARDLRDTLLHGFY